MSLLPHVLLALASSASTQNDPVHAARSLHLTGPYGETRVADAEVWIVDVPPWDSNHGPGGDELIPWIQRVGRHARTDAEGRVELLRGESPYLVHAETAEYVTSLPSASSQVGGPWQDRVDDARGDVWLRMLPKGPVEVTVLDAAGRPVADREVHIPLESTHPPDYDDSLTSARTDRDGVARLAWAGAVSTGYGWGGHLSEGATVVVTLPLQTTVKTWVRSGERGLLQLPPTVDLVVHGPTGGGRIELERARRPDDFYSGFAGRLGQPPPVVDRLGRFQDGMVVRSVPFTAPFTVRIRVSGDRTVERSIDPAEFAAPSELHVELATPGGAPPPRKSALLLTCRLVDDDGVPLAGGRLGWSSGGHALDEDGRFSALQGFPGHEKKLWARARWGGPYHSYLTRVPDDAVGPRVDLGTLYPVRDRVLVAGRVVDEAGRPVAGATVRIFDPESKNTSHPSLFAATDARGRFFQSWRDGDAVAQRLYLTAAEGGRHARWSEVTPGDAEVELTLLAGGVVRATLALDEEVPTANLVAQLEGPLRDRSTLEPRRRVPFADGGFEFGALPEGTYALQFLALGTEPPFATVESLQVVPGQIEDRDLGDEDPSARVTVAEILVVDSDGAPAAGARAWLGNAPTHDFDRYAAVACSADGWIRLALHPGVALGTETARATITARGCRRREVVLVPGEQQVVLEPPSRLTLRLGEALARERASATIELFQWSDLHGLVRLVPTDGSAESGVLTFAVDDPGPWEPRWVEGGRSWTIDDPSDTDLVRYTQWLEVPDEGLELRLEE